MNKNTKQRYWEYCCCCILLPLIVITSLTLPQLLRGSLRISSELNTQNYQGNYEFLELSLTKPTTVSMKSEDKSVKVYNLTSTDEKDRGVWMLPLNMTGNVNGMYLCSRIHGEQNTSSFCGTYFYTKVDFNSVDEIKNFKDYDFLVVDG